jgi:hypothetical protein
MYALEFHGSTSLTVIASNISQPGFPDAVRTFLYTRNHPDRPVPEDLDNSYDGPIRIYSSASACYYCTAIFNSALGVTCDLSAELYLPAELNVTCDQPKISADNIFGGMLLPRREEILFLIIL